MTSRSNEKLSLPRQLIRFIIVGVICTGIDFGTFLVLTYCHVVTYVVANVVAYSVGLVSNYLLSLAFVFTVRTEQGRLREFAGFAVLTLIGFGINELILVTCVEYLHQSAALAKVLATAVVMLYNFLSRKLWLEG